MKKILMTLMMILLLAASAAALTSGFAPCNEVDGVVRCYTEQYVPYWDSLCPQCWISDTPPPDTSPDASNAVDNCASCHIGKPDNKFKFSNWTTDRHKKHQSLSCTKCHVVK